MPETLEITDTDIERCGAHFDCDFSDESRRKVLRSTDTCDVQACPGGGKTRLLVAKLAILASKWRWRDRGICVLSHTNVARHEVERLLGPHPAGVRLLHYPHFVGTIQAFVDRFLALPCLRDEGITVQAIDNDRFATAAWRSFESHSAPKAKAYYAKKRERGRSIVHGLRLSGPALGVSSANGNLPGANTDSYKQLRRLELTLCKEGLFRYDDMYALAQARLFQCSDLQSAIQHRFPWVFLDEMQDTSALQDAILQTVFSPTGTILQRFGDSNQAIYGGTGDTEAQGSFPRKPTIDIPDSKRLGQSIANIATPFAVVSPQKLIGRQDVACRPHTIFTFDKTTIDRVLPAFGDLLLDTFANTEPPEFRGAAAVGAIKRPRDETRTDFPYNVGDYWSEFDPALSVQSTPQCFVDFVRLARAQRDKQGECADAYRTLVQPFLHTLHRTGAKGVDGRRFTRKSLLAELDSKQALAPFQNVARGMCLGSKQIDSNLWESMAAAIRTVLQPICVVGTDDEFLQWRATPGQTAAIPPPARRQDGNLFCHERDGRQVAIQVTTIHGVKGQTHTATLVLETYYYEHDLGNGLVRLVAQHAKGGPAKRELDRTKRLYVAMTRPTDLLCLAIHKEHVEPHREALVETGWTISDLHVPSLP